MVVIHANIFYFLKVKFLRSIRLFVKLAISILIHPFIRCVLQHVTGLETQTEGFGRPTSEVMVSILTHLFPPLVYKNHILVYHVINTSHQLITNGFSVNGGLLLPLLFKTSD